MKFIISCLIILLINIHSFSQNKGIDTAFIKNWRKLGESGISGDGKFIWYTEKTDAGINITHVCDTKGEDKLQIQTATNLTFTANSKYLLWTSNEGIVSFNLSNFRMDTIPSASNMKLAPEARDLRIFFTVGGSLCLRDLRSETVENFGFVKDYYINHQGTALIAITDTTACWVDLRSGKKMSIFNGEEIKDFCLHPLLDDCVFTGRINGALSLYSYKLGASKPEILFSVASQQILPGADLIKEGTRYSEDGNYLFFKLRAPKIEVQRDTDLITSSINIWSFKDKAVQSEQLTTAPFQQEYLSVISLRNRKIMLLENEQQSVFSSAVKDHILVRNRIHEFEKYWNGEVPAYRLVSLLTGEQKPFIPSTTKNPIHIQLSAAGKYVSWLDADSRITYYYSMDNSLISTISNKIPDKGDTVCAPFHGTFELAGWLKNDQYAIGFDDYDIWQVSPLYPASAVCLTGGVGKTYQIKFRPLESLGKYETLGSQGNILLTAMEISSKKTGLTKIRLSKENTIDRNFLKPSLNYFPGIVLDDYIPPPVKASSNSSCIFLQQSDRQPINLYYSKDFIDFTQISHIHPLPSYASYRADLINWQNGDGSCRSGILYVPENLDTTKVHPIIFNYYEERSYERYQYRTPGLSHININIPWYVSRGYVVAVVDVSKAKGRTGPAALEAVEGAAKHLVNKYKWIDSNKMGLQGHSHGGYITNYIATHSKMFAAAQASAGYTDFISGYGQLSNEGVTMQFMQEVGQNNLGTTPWENLPVYIDNSCIFETDKMVTPILLMHSKGDNVVHFNQSVELFTSLRRLQKPVWLLEYENEDHVLGDYEHILDFSLRQQQFFDHYLKSKPMPEWMRIGVPAVSKGIKSGFKPVYPSWTK